MKTRTERSAEFVAFADREIALADLRDALNLTDGVNAQSTPEVIALCARVVELTPAATQIAADPEKGSTGVFSGEHILTIGMPHGRTHAGMCACGWWRFIVADNYPKHPDEIIKEGHRVHLADVAAELNRGIKS